MTDFYRFLLECVAPGQYWPFFEQLENHWDQRNFVLGVFWMYGRGDL